MSTKATILYSNNPESDFHLYYEMGDDDAVYLNVRNPRREDPKDDYHYEDTIRIPLEIWEVIKKADIVDLSMTEWSDEDVKAYARNRAYFHFADVAGTFKIRNENEDASLSSYGSWVYGPPEEGLAGQLQNAESHFFGVRKKQLELKKKIEVITQLNGGRLSTKYKVGYNLDKVRDSSKTLKVREAKNAGKNLRRAEEDS